LCSYTIEVELAYVTLGDIGYPVKAIGLLAPKDF